MDRPPPAAPASEPLQGAPELLRARVLRHLDALPEAQLLHVLDFIEFLSSRYACTAVAEPTTALGRFGERFQDRLRAQRVGWEAMRGALQAVAAADRVIASALDAGRGMLEPGPRQSGKGVPGTPAQESSRRSPGGANPMLDPHS